MSVATIAATIELASRMLSGLVLVVVGKKTKLVGSDHVLCTKQTSSIWDIHHYILDRWGADAETAAGTAVAEGAEITGSVGDMIRLGATSTG